MSNDENYLTQLEFWTPTIESLVELNELVVEINKRLSEKRATLEEKMIRTELHGIAAACLEIAQHAHLRLRSANATDSLPSLDELNLLVREIRQQLQELLKIIKYDLNFLEQYFEYNFNAKLQNRHHFSERLEAIAEDLNHSFGK